MRIFARSSKSSLNSNPSDIIRHPRRAVILASEIITLMILLLICLPIGSDYLKRTWQAQLTEVAENARIEASANRQEHLCLQISVYWEMKRKRVKDAAAIAGNMMTRVSLPEYPDTVCEVVNEVRKHRTSGKETAMYSYIFDGRSIPAYDDADWVSAGIVSENVMYAYNNGLPYIRSVNYLTPAAYKVTEWAYNWQKHCEIKPLPLEGVYHIFFDKMTKQERRECLDSNKDEIGDFILASQKPEIKKIPIPIARPRA